MSGEEVKKKDDANGEQSDSVEVHPPSIFTDKKGNLKFVNLVVRFPLLVFFVILGACLFISFLLVKIVIAGGNPLNNEGSYDLKDVRSVAYDSLQLALDEVTSSRDASTTLNVTASPQEEVLDITYWIYESQIPEGVFGSRESLEAMKETLALFTEHNNYEEYCWKVYEEVDGIPVAKCRPLVSALNMYYASSWDEEAVQGVINQLEKPGSVQLYNMLGVCVEFQQYCDIIPNFIKTPENIEWATSLNANMTAITSSWDGSGELIEDIGQGTMLAAYFNKLATKRYLLDFSYDINFSVENPVSRYSRSILVWGGPLNVTHDEDEGDVLKEYIVENFLDDMNTLSNTKYNPEINSYYFMPALILDVLLDILIRDALLAIISFSFVFIYIRIMVGSWFLGMVGALQILFAVPVSWFFFNTVFQIEYFSGLNALTLYIVAAIGADDIFIFMDAYKQSVHQNPKILESLESRMSWVYRRTGSAMAITSATTCSAFLCTLLTPIIDVRTFGVFAALVIFIDYVLVMTLFCTGVVIYHNKFEKDGCCCEPTCCYGGFCATANPTSTQKAYTSDGELKRDRISLFFRNRVAKIIHTPMYRVVIGIIFLVWLITAAIFASGLEPTKETEQFLDNNHPLQKSATILDSAFPIADNDIGLEIYFTYGVGELDRSGVNLFFEPTYLGRPVFFESFNFDEQCQREMLRVCDELKTNEDFKPYIKQKAGLGTVNCFVEEFGAFVVNQNLDDCQGMKSGLWRNESWQVSPDDIPDIMENFLLQKSCYSDEGASILNHYKEEIGWNGSSLKFASISVENSVVDPFSVLSESVVRKQYNKMVEITDILNENADACGSKVLMTDLNEKFVFMNTQTIYVRTALSNSFLGLGIAFTVLLLSTRVLHLSLLATCSIVCVLVSVVGSIVIAGWQLGSIESILISITAGFSVDYVVHLAHAYNRASGDTNERITEAFGEMGISVLNGMVTSVGASIPLFLCKLQFFKKFGTFLCLTILFSWLFANLGFMSVIAQIKVPIKKGYGCRP